MKTELYRVLVEGNNNKERTAKVYAATLRRIHKQVYKKELAAQSMAELPFLRTAKVHNFVKKIVNLTRRKNAATAVVQGLKATKAPEKTIGKFRTIMMQSDKDYQAFLVSGKRKRPFKNAETAWKDVIGLHKKVAKEIEATRLWDLGGSVTPGEYRVLNAWLLLKWLAALPPRRLEYTETRLVTKKEYEASDKSGNYIVMGARKWVWAIHKYKTIDKYGPQKFPVPGPLKAALNRIKPIVFAKSDKGFIFLNNKFKPFSRSQFSAFVKWIFKRYLGKNWTMNTIRSIKVSSVWTPTMEDPLKLAQSMGHDVTTALLHYRQV